MSCYPERRKGVLTGKWIAEATKNGVRVGRKRFDTKLDGERWADYITLTGAAPVEAGKVVGHTFGTVAAEALEHHVGWQRDRDPTRGQRLEYVTDVLGKDTPITIVRAVDLDRLVKTLKGRPGRSGKLAPGTINRYLAVASAVLTFAKRRDYIVGIPTVPWQKEVGKRIHWVTEQVEAGAVAFMLSCGQKDAALSTQVLTATGLRWSEFYGLEPDMVTDEWVKLDATKTDHPRDVPIDPALAVRLVAMLKAGTRPPYYTFSKLLKAALKSAGQSAGFSPHILRHTTATRLVLKGINLAIVKDFMGHASLNTTLKYVHVTQIALADASKILSPRAGQTAPITPQDEFDEDEIDADTLEFMEATPGIEPGCKDLQSEE